MNIQKLEVVLDEMRRTSFSDATLAEALVQKWADQIADAITEHLLAELGGTTSPAGAEVAVDLYPQPGGHGWDEVA